MNTMGKIIKTLRQERGMTQEELAERLGVTYQAVSRWETDGGMPDISLILPLAGIFGVSTDTLFGVEDEDACREEILRLIQDADFFRTSPPTVECLRASYTALKEGLKKYPDSPLLLMRCLEVGTSLAYPENETCDRECGRQIYRQCIGFADRICKYGKNAGDILRAHMILVLLHSAYGNSEAAEKHAEMFPIRSDMTWQNMKASIAHAQKAYGEERVFREWDFLYHLESMLNTVTELGCCYDRLGRHGDAREVFEFALRLAALVGEREALPLALHHRERGDPYALLAKSYLRTNEREKALETLQKMTDFDLSVRRAYRSGMKLRTPLLRDVDTTCDLAPSEIPKRLWTKLTDPDFAELRECEEYRNLLQRAQSAADEGEGKPANFPA